MEHRSLRAQGMVSGDTFKITDAPRHYAPDMRLFPVDGDIKLSLSIAEGALSGTVSWRLRQTAPESRVVELDAVDLDIGHVWSTAGAEISHDYNGRRLRVEWSEGASLDGECLNVEWTVVRPSAGLYFVGSMPDRTQLPYVGLWTDHETERARYWLPCLDHPAVRTTVTLALETDLDVTHIGCGLKASDASGDFGRRTQWRLDEPCPAYLLCFAAGHLAHHGFTGHDGLSLDVFGFEPTTAQALGRSFEGTADMMSWMTKRLGVEFPYPKYWQFVGPGIGGAMENISLTSWDQRFFSDEATHQEFGGWVDIINLHEMAHSYFGDSVVIRDFSHAWLKEGWATYMESVWLSETVDADTGFWLLQEDRLAYLDEVNARYERPVITREFDHSWHMYDRHLYQGSAWRIHMLRAKLGEADFWQATQQYLTQYASKCAETDDFRRCLEEVSGFHLSRFFEDWFRRPGCPGLTLSMQVSDKGGRTALATLIMDKPSDGGEFFELELDIGLLDESGNWQRKRVVFDQGRGSANFSLDGEVRQVVVDPDGTQLFKLKTEVSASIYATMVSECPLVVGRVQAAQALASQGDRLCVQALRSAYQSESHFGVRRILSKIVAEAKTGWRIGLLLEWLGHESDPRVEFVVAQGLSGVTLATTQVSQVRARLKQAQGQFLRCALMDVLGAQRAQEDLPYLFDVVNDADQAEVVRVSALGAMGAHGSQKAYEMISAVYESLSKGVYLTNERHRTLAKCARKMDRNYRLETLDMLEVASRDAVGPEALAIASSCVLLGEKAGASLLTNLLASLDHQSGSSVKHLLAKLQASASPGEADARIDKLEARVRELEQSLAQTLAVMDSRSID